MKSKPASSRLICTECGQPCEVECRDMGVGVTEVGSFRQRDRDVRDVSTCCWAKARKEEGEGSGSRVSPLYSSLS